MIKRIFGEDVAIILKGLMKGEVTCALTGRQGAGVVNTLNSLIEYIDPKYPLSAFEPFAADYLRTEYPERNILIAPHTVSFSGNELKSALEKGNGTVYLAHELDSDRKTAGVLHIASVGGIFTLLVHTAATTKDLVKALRNSLLASGLFTLSMEQAEQKVLDTIRVNIHLNYTPEGVRYIERITELVPNYKGYELVDILRYDVETDNYYTVNRFSYELEQKIKDKSIVVWEEIDMVLQGLR